MTRNGLAGREYLIERREVARGLLGERFRKALTDDVVEMLVDQREEGRIHDLDGVLRSAQHEGERWRVGDHGRRKN